MRKHSILLSAFLALLLIPQIAQADTQVWRIDEGAVTFSLDDAHLANLGLELVSPRSTADVSDARAIELSLELPIYSFRIPGGTGLEFVTENGKFSHFVDGTVSLPVEGGLAFRAQHPMSRVALDPASVYDFAVDIDPSQEDLALAIHSLDPTLPVPLEVRNATLHVDWVNGVLSARMGDLKITDAWASKLGQDYLAGSPVGVADIRVSITQIRGSAIVEPQPNFAGARGGFQDVKIGELYDFHSYGRTGTYPTGLNGFSAATTSCNVGDVDVAWNGPMAETHPFIGLVVFRESNGILEMIGKNWMKHGFFALSNNQCTPCQNHSNGTFLGVGCSDTYSAGNNASRYYLGPRDEVAPFVGTWTACGSFFDGVPTDCVRTYQGSEPNGVNHRIEVYDEDLVVPGTFAYEGIYIIEGEDYFDNEIVWKEFSSVTWTGAQWNLNEIPGTSYWKHPNGENAYVLTWGDKQWIDFIAPDDGKAAHSVQVTDLGGGMWHYEYAVYNRNAGRGIDEITVPVGTANISNIGFHDVDKDAGNDWVGSVQGTNVVWETGTNPIKYQMMYNFRFDADVAPVDGDIIGGIWRSGAGTSFNMGSLIPNSSSVGVLPSQGATGFDLASEPNPFSDNTRLTFSVSRQQSAKLQVLDVTGRVVRTLVDGPVAAGSSDVRWDGRDASGTHVAGGVYFFRLTTAEGQKTVKSTYLR